MTNENTQPLLSVKDLRVSFHSQGLTKEAVKGISFSINQAERFALVGESGSGKSVTCASILGLLPTNARVSGQMVFEQNTIDLSDQDSDFIKQARGKKIAYVPQNPVTSLNPVRTVYSQMLETAQIYFPSKTEDELKNICLNSLEDVQMDDCERVFAAYPFELSGGMCQRVMIAMALVGEPKLLLADEPTTALDVTIQAEIMSLLIEATKKRNLSMLLITHDLALVAQSCTRLAVIKDGELCEEGQVKALYSDPQHPYTNQLLEAVKL
ncbi:MAG: ABC transporter ATP-binding protein [Candidatus Caenarcaniphilales bacterium]|nr:ABC transporter ATP-binding protein [Candidatus Caenarcaniphilales bacterium]